MNTTVPALARLSSLIRFLAGPTILFYALPWLMVLLTIGTIAQKELGIYTAQHLYFSSWIVWLGPIPAPGGYPTLGAITLCLTLKFLFYSPWRLNKAGIILSHFGVLLLMVGGLLTAMTQKEHFILFKEGQSVESLSDYHARVLRIEKDGDTLASLPFESLQQGSALPFNLPFQIRLQAVCQNCQPSMIEKPDGRRGFAAKVELLPKPLEKENEANMSGITFAVTGAPNDQNATYIAVEEIPMYPSIDMGDTVYSFHMERAQETLPFSIRLDRFQRDMHPGTMMARAYESHVIIQDNGVEWPYTIRMNKPLRYKGYTFYQSSFSIRPDGEFSTLSVVQNKGRVFPYIASAVLFAGLLLHLILRTRSQNKKSA